MAAWSILPVVMHVKDDTEVEAVALLHVPCMCLCMYLSMYPCMCLCLTMCPSMYLCMSLTCASAHVFLCACLLVHVLKPELVLWQIAKAYEEGGAACLSVLTDRKYFQGSFEYLQDIRNAGVTCPLLCKEFIVEVVARLVVLYRKLYKCK